MNISAKYRSLLEAGNTRVRFGWDGEFPRYFVGDEPFIKKVVEECMKKNVFSRGVSKERIARVYVERCDFLTSYSHLVRLRVQWNLQRAAGQDPLTVFERVVVAINASSDIRCATCVIIDVMTYEDQFRIVNEVSREHGHSEWIFTYVHELENLNYARHRGVVQTRVCLRRAGHIGGMLKNLFGTKIAVYSKSSYPYYLRAPYGHLELL
jgi:hypothetical protein